MRVQLFVKDRRFYQALAGLALPIVAQQMITVGVNLADNMMLGQLGEAPMSAAGLANNFITLFQIMCMGLGMGASVLTSRYYGMNDQNSLKKAVLLMMKVLLFVASFFALVTAFFPTQIMRMYTTEETVIAEGASYLLISLPCYYLNGYALTTSLLLRSVGKANIPLLSSIASFFINIFCNWVFIFGHLGAPALGVRGAALGTLLARIVEFIVTMGYLFVKDARIGLKIRDLTMDCKDLRAEYIRISLPVLVSDSLLGLGNNAVGVVMGHIGSTFVAANSIVSLTMSLATVIIQGISQASCTITGITLGEGNRKKAQEQGVTFAVLGLLLGLLGCGIILVLQDVIIGCYKVTPETRILAKELMAALGIVIVFQCMNSILTKGVLRGGGDTKFLMVADILFLWCASIPLGAVAGLVFRWSGFYVFLLLKVDQVIKAIWCIFRLKSGKWIKKIERAGE